MSFPPPSGILYYRLRITKAGSADVFSPVATVDFTSPAVYALSSFTVVKVNNNVKLHWTSVNEVGYDKYYIQRGTTPTGFADIANVNATNLASNSYAYFCLGWSKFQIQYLFRFVLGRGVVFD